VERNNLNPIFIDTVFVIGLVNRRDQYHTQALQRAQRYLGQPLLVTDAVLLEIGNALARYYKKESVAIIEQFLTAQEVEIVHLSPNLFNKAFVLYKQYQDKQWGLVDCISFVVMQERDLSQVLTFDQHFVQAGFEALMKVST
jgi:predicted nucleic acid-binding protein